MKLKNNILLVVLFVSCTFGTVKPDWWSTIKSWFGYRQKKHYHQWIEKTVSKDMITFFKSTVNKDTSEINLQNNSKKTLYDIKVELKKIDNDPIKSKDVEVFAGVQFYKNYKEAIKEALSRKVFLIDRPRNVKRYRGLKVLLLDSLHQNDVLRKIEKQVSEKTARKFDGACGLHTLRHGKLMQRYAQTGDKKVFQLMNNTNSSIKDIVKLAKLGNIAGWLNKDDLEKIIHKDIEIDSNKILVLDSVLTLDPGKYDFYSEIQNKFDEIKRNYRDNEDFYYTFTITEINSLERLSNPGTQTHIYNVTILKSNNETQIVIIDSLKMNRHLEKGGKGWNIITQFIDYLID